MRFVMAIITLLTVSFIVFSLMELVPANCAERYLAFKNSQGQQISVSDIEAEEIRMGLDKPYVVRWVNWVSDVFLRGDFGTSCILRVRVNDLLGTKFWISLGICLASLMLAYTIAIPVGINSATTNKPGLNNFQRFVSYLGLAKPNFLLA